MITIYLGVLLDSWSGKELRLNISLLMLQSRTTRLGIVDKIKSRVATMSQNSNPYDAQGETNANEYKRN